MAGIVILGAGLNGLSAALLLAADGHRVTVLERDAHHPPAPTNDRAPTDPAPTDQVWTEWRRRGVNQFRHPHLMMPRWHATMERELPEVTAELRAAGGRPFNLLEAVPSAGARREGDQQFDTIAARRPAVEAALAVVAARSPGIEVRRGVAVTGLTTRRVRSGDVAPGTAVPHVTGVRVSADGVDGGDTVSADLVVDAGGRRSALPDLLDAIGARPPIEERDDCGFVYYARHFRSTDGSTPAYLAGLLQHHPTISILSVPGDRPPGGRDTWSVAIITSAHDRELRALRDPATWNAVLATFPLSAHWAHGEPLTGVDVIAGIEDRHRRFVVDGEPVATGLVAIGDAWAAATARSPRSCSCR